MCCRRVVPVLGLLVLTSVAGCGSNPSASGTVTLDGQPVNDAYIQFLTLDSEVGQQPKAAEIVRGKYTITDLHPGKTRVQVAGKRESRIVVDDPANPDRPGSERVQVFDKPDIPDDAEGSSTEVEIKPGANVVNMTLRSPPEKKQ